MQVLQVGAEGLSVDVDVTCAVKVQFEFTLRQVLGKALVQDDELVEGVHHEEVHRREKQRRGHQHRRHIRHHRAVLLPVLDDDERGINRQQPPPEE